jgi:flagellar hook-associated protein 3 FlgL
MVSSIDPSGEQFLASLALLQKRYNQAQEQVTSGLRILRPSDSPGQLADLFQTRTDLARVTQVDQNLVRVKAEVDTAESAVSTAVQYLDQVRALGVQGAGTIAAGQDAALAPQVNHILQQLVGLSRTSVHGVYIFSGDQTNSPPYQVNAASATGVDRLVTVPATRLIQDPTGVNFAIAKTAQDIFDHRDALDNPAPDNVFAAVNSLQVALQNGDQPGVTNALDALKTAQDYLNQQLAFYGSVQKRIDSGIDLAKKFETQLQTNLSAQQDADIPAAVIQLTQDQTHLNAALAAQGRRPTTSLFDFLK